VYRKTLLYIPVLVVCLVNLLVFRTASRGFKDGKSYCVKKTGVHTAGAPSKHREPAVPSFMARRWKNVTVSHLGNGKTALSP